MDGYGKRYIEGESSLQSSFLPWSLDDTIDAENPVRFIRLFVESLDLHSMGFVRAKAAATGRPGYDPRALLCLYVYGHLNRIRSSRTLERECRRNVELWWLLDKLVPDHNTISDFRMENRTALQAVFKAFVTVCMELNLVSGKQICIDGTPMKAVNSMKQSTTMELSKKKLAYAREQLALVEAYLNELDSADQIDQGKLCKPFALDICAQKLPSKESIQKRIHQHEQAIAQMQETGETQILDTDPDARVMKTKDGGRRACYNVQTAVESDNHLVVGFDVTNDRNDANNLCSTAEIAKENLNTGSIEAIADKGYESSKDIKESLMNGIVPDVGFVYDRDFRVFSLDYVPADITQVQKASQRKEDIQACLHAGVLPDCYENTNISIEVQRQNEISCFLRHEDGRVTCPMRRELFVLRKRKYGTVYGSREACRTCPNRCTDGKGHKTVKFGEQTIYVPVILYGCAKYPVQQIPDVQQPNHYHAFGRVNREEARVMIFIKRDIAKQKKRMYTNEHVFGTVKYWDNASYYLCRGKEKVAAETALMYLSYNIRRAINAMGGVQNLMQAFQGVCAPICPQTS